MRGTVTVSQPQQVVPILDRKCTGELHMDQRKESCVIADELLNTLTKDEWNAAYFLGLEELHRGPFGFGVHEQIKRGARRLVSAGYAFERLKAASGGSLQPTRETESSREHRAAFQEMADGSFDTIGRARETLDWLATRLPNTNRAWLRDLLSLYDQTRAGVESKIQRYDRTRTIGCSSVSCVR